MGPYLYRSAFGTCPQPLSWGQYRLLCEKVYQVYRPCLPVVRLARVRNPCPGDNIDYTTSFDFDLLILSLGAYVLRDPVFACGHPKLDRPFVLRGLSPCSCICICTCICRVSDSSQQIANFHELSRSRTSIIPR